jgi:uncharacterized membrane protein
MEELILQLSTLGLFFVSMAGLLVGLPWLFWIVAKLFKLGCFHPLAQRD